MHRAVVAFCLVAVFVLVSGLGATRSTAPQGTPSGAAATDLTAVSVHVVDRAGKPVKDLKQADFTVLENGAPQQIRFFAVQDMTPGAADSTASLAPRTRAALAPQNQRIFLIMLGRGRLEDPSKALTSTTAFVRKLMPQDLVAVFTQDRALSFTTDHEKVAQVLERCRKTHLDVDLDVDSQLGPVGMAALYGTKAVSRKMQTRIDEMLLGPGAKPPAVVAVDSWPETAFRDLSLDDFMYSSAQTLQDRNNLQMVLEYLRHYQGEKHMLFLTEKGLDKASTLPSDEYDDAIAQLANDGQTAIHTLQTGGMFAVAEAGKELETTQQQSLAFAELRKIAEASGGWSAIMEKGGSALDRLDEVTKTGYLVGYQPANSGWDGRYRTITVRVNRPDVTVSYRRGYYRLQEPGGFYRAGQVVADRLMAAGNFRREISDIKIKAKASQNQGRGGGALSIDGKIDMVKLVLKTVDGKHVGTLHVAVFCLDTANQAVGNHDTKLPISLTDDEFARYQKDGMPYSLQFPMPPGTNSVRFVVYDAGADLIGRADTKVF
jgi:VWFA-related protein